MKKLEVRWELADLLSLTIPFKTRRAVLLVVPPKRGCLPAGQQQPVLGKNGGFDK
jgi:hypothetical protein